MNFKNKVGIVTFYAGGNCGAALQAYATCEVVKTLIDKDDIVELVNWQGSKSSPSLKDMLYAHAKANFPRKMYHLFNFIRLKLRRGCPNWLKFMYNYLPTGELTNLDDNRLLDFTDTTHSYDVLITGSDQVWATADPFFFLQVVGEQPRLKIAYAASCGSLERITEDEHTAIHNYLADFAAISCRELQSVDFIASLTEKPVRLMPDPTLLLDKEHWSKLALPPSDAPKGKFLFVYRLWRCKNTMRQAKLYAKRHGLIIYDSCPKNPPLSYYNKIGPREFLWCILHAECVITHSFHGVALSINLGTDFYAIKTPAPQGRIVTLLEQTDLMERYVEKDITDAIEARNGKADKSVLAEFSERGRNFLKESLQQ